ncbi:family transcriptional regulator [Chlorella sorokiniana]|uniref:Family transcriptional regulator n=1 Tax=Chlorella sorokiniana TaxID=3076 RepID=A0A2P6TWB7_CHLSO|nr:family transcriptional regulator [Chlorella sorokiniana]|eukprot:PRW58353.1 family transcriptional regulator [Chlorella sorokiniana]
MGDTVRTVRPGAYLSRLTSLSLEPDAYAFRVKQDFLDIFALAGATALLELSLCHSSDEPYCTLRGAQALAAGAKPR